jgi:hypothetical protein
MSRALRAANRRIHFPADTHEPAPFATFMDLMEALAVADDPQLV